MRAVEQRLAELMRAARAGDAAAYRQFLADAGAMLRTNARAALARAGRGNAEVEDIVQETLLAIHLKRESWSEDRPISPWLNAIARYKLVDVLRRLGVRRAIPIDDVVDELPAPAEVPAVDADVRRLVDALPERSRRIVVAMSIEGRSAAEVGRDVGMNEGAVRVALHRALKELARRYREGFDAHR
ncbi:MAG: sigma-70 family RNA polymerase sigma factor [Rhizobiales bacterium]|nr:sigma-70 family RNA polymerase sigma factor [Hyphomicrobiales bacterium]